MRTPFSQTVEGFYDAWAEQIPGRTVRFLNYGLEDPGALGTDWIQPGDEPYRLHLNLIRYLLMGVTTEKQSVMEISSGRGGNCQYIAEYTQARRVVGIDRCVGNVRLSKERVNSPRVSFAVGDAEALAVRSNSVEVVVSLEASHCYGRFPAFLAEVRRVLKPGGTLCFADLWGLSLAGVDWDQRESDLRSSGLEIVRHEDITRGVFRALESEDQGIFEFLAPDSRDEPTELGERIATVTRELRTHLAIGACRYRLWHLEKPPQGDAP